MMFEEQEVITFFTGKGWSEKDIHKYKIFILAELNLFATSTNITIEDFYTYLMSECDADEYERHQIHLAAHTQFTHQFVKDLIQTHNRTNFFMFIMTLLFIGYSFFLN